MGDHLRSDARRNRRCCCGPAAAASGGPTSRRDEPTYYNCGQPGARFSQPGFSKFAVRWLIDTGVLAKRGALGTDTFGPDPSSDALFNPESWLTLNRHRFTLENLTNLGEMPPTGG